jgi:hypothetical protein
VLTKGDFERDDEVCVAVIIARNVVGRDNKITVRREQSIEKFVVRAMVLVRINNEIGPSFCGGKSSGYLRRRPLEGITKALNKQRFNMWPHSNSDTSFARGSDT